MKVLEDIKELISDEVKEIKKKGTHTPAEFEFMKTAVETIENIERICKKHNIGSDYNDEYSGRTMPRMGRYYGGYDMPMDRMYYGGDRYDNYSGTYDDRYSGRGGRHYYGHAEPGEKIVRELKEMLDRPMSNYERGVIMDTIDELSK